MLILIVSHAQAPGGPYTSDANTILLMHFDGDLSNSASLSSNGVAHGSGISFIPNANSELGQCLKIDNSNASNKSYVSVPHNANLSLSASWTIEAWVYFTSIGSNSAINPTIVSKSNTDNANYFLWYHNGWGSAKAQFTNSNNQAVYVAIGNNTITTGKWFHLAYIRDADQNLHRLIIRNEAQEVIIQNEFQYDALQATPNTNTNDLLIGSLGLIDNFYFDGYMDELRISNVVRTFLPSAPATFPEELDQVRIENKVNALNLHRMKSEKAPYSLKIKVLSTTEYGTQKPTDALAFDCGYVDQNGVVYVSEPSSVAQQEVFENIDQAATYYMCQSFLQYYYNASEMPLWFKTGFAAYESAMHFDDAAIKTAYNNYGASLTSFDVLNNPTTFVANNGLAIAYLFGEFIGVFKTWGYYMVQSVNASSIIPNASWYNAGTEEALFDYFMKRYFYARILETNEQERLKRGMQTEHFNHYYRDKEDYWLAYFPDILEEAIAEYMDFMNFEPYEKFSSLTLPICNYVTIGGGECVNLRYTSGTAWASGIWASSPNADNANDIQSFVHLIRHELAHLVQAQIGAKNMTAWLNEGFAELMSRGPSTLQEKIALKSQTEKTLNDAITYFGHLPTFEDTKVYPGQTNVDYYLLGQIMQNFIYETGGYTFVKEVVIDAETAIKKPGFCFVRCFYVSLLSLSECRIPKNASA